MALRRDFGDPAVVPSGVDAVAAVSRRHRKRSLEVKVGRIAVLSTSWQTAALMAPQDHDYRAFIIELHARMKQAASNATLTGGLRPRIYAAAVVLLTLVAIAMAGLFIRAIATGEWAGVLFLVGFAALFAWQIGGFVAATGREPTRSTICRRRCCRRVHGWRARMADGSDRS